MIGKSLYIYSRKLHRILLFVVSTLTLIMGMTGLVMKYPKLGAILHLENSMVRYVHNKLSVLFVAVLGAMMLTGLYMYFYPWYQQRRALRDTSTAPPPQPPTYPL